QRDRDIRKEMYLLEPPPGHLRDLLQVVLERVEIGVGDVEREEVGPRPAERVDHVVVRLGLRRGRARDAADGRAQAPAEEDQRLAARNRLQRPREDLARPARNRALFSPGRST